MTKPLQYSGAAFQCSFSVLSIWAISSALQGTFCARRVRLRRLFLALHCVRRIQVYLLLIKQTLRMSIWRFFKKVQSHTLMQLDAMLLKISVLEKFSLKNFPTPSARMHESYRLVVGAHKLPPASRWPVSNASPLWWAVTMVSAHCAQGLQNQGGSWTARDQSAKRSALCQRTLWLL